MTKRIHLLLLLLCFKGFSQLDLIETTELKLVTYDFGHKYILPHATRSFHKSLEYHKNLFNFEPSEKITVLIQDFGDYGNAGATAVPKNVISMGLSPFSYTFETNPAGERVFSMMNHELVHVIALDHATKSDRFFRSMFLGKVQPENEHPISIAYGYLTSPRRYSPRWFHEGIASYLETWMNGGVGLALGSYDEMVFRTKVLEEDRIYSAQGLESEGVTSDFQGRSNSYLYGTRFMGYLAYEYGPETLIEWVKRSEGSKTYFSKQFKHVYGKPIAQAWDEWIAFEKDWQKKNLDNLKKNPITQPQIISDRLFGSVSYPQYDAKNNKIYVAVNYPGKIPHIAAFDLADESYEHLVDIKGAALFFVSSLTYDPEDEIIFYTTDNGAWRDLSSYDLKTKKNKRLQKDFRTGDLAFNRTDKSIWGIKHLHGRSTIVKIPKHDKDEADPSTYSSWQKQHTMDYGHDIFDIDISPDGTKLSAAVSDLNGNQSLILYDLKALEQNEVVADTIYNFEITSPQSFRFSEDGKYLTGCSYFSGVSNIYRVDLETFNIKAMSNAETGMFRPLIIDDEKLFVFNFTSQGFQPAYIPNIEELVKVARIDFLGNQAFDKYPILKEWELEFPREEDLDLEAVTLKTGKYKPGELLDVNYGYPTIIGYKDYIGFGYHLKLSDPFNFRSLDLSVSYTPRSWHNGLSDSSDDSEMALDDDELIHFSMHAKLGSFEIFGGYNEANFYDLFGPTKFSRKGINLNVNFNRSLLWDGPKNIDLNLGAGGYYGLEESPAFQQIDVTGFDETFFFDFQAGISYRNLRNSLGAVDNEKGIATSLGASTTLSAGNLFPRVTGTLDLGTQTPIKHMSFWLRNAVGHSFESDLNPFTRYGFAAFGNNYVDYRGFRRYRTPFSFPGLQYDADLTIVAKSYSKNTAELVFPPIRFRKLGTFNLFANWIQPTAFGSFLITDEDPGGTGKYANLGIQVDTRFVLFSLLPSTLSVGYAKAWDLDSKMSFDEWMISLKLLR